MQLTTNSTRRVAIVLDGLEVFINGNFSDITVEPLGHVLINAEDATLRPVTQNCALRLMGHLQHQPRAVLSLLERLERVAKTVYPEADTQFSWAWELPALPVEAFCCVCAC